MADLVIKRGDTRPKLVRNLQQTVDGVVSNIDLTMATSVRLILKAQTGSATGGGACTITDAVNGEVTYTWASADTATVTLWNAEWEITWNDSGIETVPSDSYITIQVY